MNTKELNGNTASGRAANGGISPSVGLRDQGRDTTGSPWGGGGGGGAENTQRCLPQAGTVRVLPGKLIAKGVEVCLHTWIRSTSQKHKLPPALQSSPCSMLDEVNALLVSQPRDDPDNRNVTVRQSKSVAQFPGKREEAVR